MAKKVEPEIKEGLPGWMGTYGDLVTLLLCFFVLLFAMSSIDVTKYKLAVASFKNQVDVMPGGEALIGEEMITNGVSQLTDIQIMIPEQLPLPVNEDNVDGSKINEYEVEGEAKEVAENIADYLAENDMDADIVVSATSDYVKLSMSGEALFDSGRADIKESAHDFLETINQVIVENEYDKYMMQIDGHTDNVPMNTVQFPSNWYLSAARSIAVGTVFIDEYGYSPSMVTCAGYGEFKPIADNMTAEGRAENRRVEIKIILNNEEKVVGEEVVFNGDEENEEDELPEETSTESDDGEEVIIIQP